MNRLVILLVSIILFLTACGSQNDDRQQDKSSSGTNTFSTQQMETESDIDQYDEDHAATNNDIRATENGEITKDRMIIHTAELYIQVKDLEKTQLLIEDKTTKYGGYIIESNVYRHDDEYLSGNMTIRIPEKHFQTFLTDTEEAANVEEKIITGQDVTEDYIDLESRLTSKKIVEERLLSFMEEATKTSDLLTISADLAEIQEEIELIVGKMNYLDNQTAYATIMLSMSEDKVVIPELDSSQLDTWEKTKRQFTTSVNTILTGISKFIIFFIGNLPVIGLLAILIATAFFIARIKRQSKE